MSATRHDLFARLDALGIAHQTTEHPPIFTVAEGAEIKATLPGLHTKNLFLKARKSEALFLLCAEGSAEIKVNQLHKVLGCKRLSFGSAEVMQEVLGVSPGSVTLFAVINDAAGRVKLLIDEKLADAEIVNFHPLKNDATTAISGADMIRFATVCEHEPRVLSRGVLAGDSDVS
jgi:Ala-tRNA(Pro) deacylase